MHGIGRSLSFLLVFLIGCCPGESHAGFVEHANIPYAAIAGVAPNLLSLDVYAPDSKPSTPAPVVIWIHGGGWAIGDKAGQMQYKPALFTGAGYCLVSANYRLSSRTDPPDPNGVKYPVHEQDVASAIGWVHAHVADYGGDPARIALAGHSAGAQLVALVGTDASFLTAQGLTLSAICGVAALDGEYDMPRVISTGRTAMYTNAFGSDPKVWRQASPIYNIAEGRHIPPMLVVERGSEERRAQADAFLTALRKAGVSGTALDAKGYTHNQVNSEIGAPGDAVMTPPLMHFLATCFPHAAQASK